MKETGNDKKLYIEPTAESENKNYRSLAEILKDAYERSKLTENPKRTSSEDVKEKEKTL